MIDTAIYIIGAAFQLITLFVPIKLLLKTKKRSQRENIAFSTAITITAVSIITSRIKYEGSYAILLALTIGITLFPISLTLLNKHAKK